MTETTEGEGDSVYEEGSLMAAMCAKAKLGPLLLADLVPRVILFGVIGVI